MFKSIKKYIVWGIAAIIGVLPFIIKHFISAGKDRRRIAKQFSDTTRGIKDNDKRLKKGIGDAKDIIDEQQESNTRTGKLLDDADNAYGEASEALQELQKRNSQKRD